MVAIVHEDRKGEEPIAKERFHPDKEVSIKDLPLAKSDDDEKWGDMSSNSNEDFTIL